MPQKPRITFGSPAEPRNQALVDGLVQIDGYEIEHIGKYSPGEFHYRFVQGEYDVCVMSTVTFLRTKERGKRFVALPVFFQRGPRQLALGQRIDRPISEDDLARLWQAASYGGTRPSPPRALWRCGRCESDP
jgi:hypothetical protein